MPDPIAKAATPTNWTTTPVRAWAFQHMAEILPTATIAAGPGPAMPLPEAPRNLDGFSLARPGGVTLGLDSWLEATATDAIVILHEGRVVFERYANGMRPETPHIAMSVSKAMTGLVAGIVAGRGEMDVESLVSNHVPEIAGSAYAGATVRDLLDMRTGVVLDEKQEAMRAAALSGERGPAGEAAPTFHQSLASLKATKGPHGGPFSYISANTDLVGWVIERATGRSFADLASELFWGPLGAGHPASILVDGEGSPWCTGGFSFTARDFARVGEMVMNGGRSGGAQVVPEAWIRDLSHGGDREAWRTGEWGQAFRAIGREMSYRAGWYAIHDEPGLLFAMGVHGQNLFVDHANRIVIAKLCSQERFDYPVVALTHAAIPELRRCILAA